MKREIGRRSFLQAGAAAAAAYLSGCGSSGSSASTGPIVETAYGRLRGAVIEGVSVFKGVRYGAPTGGERRFLPPVKPEAWAGVQDALAWGQEAPQPHPHTEIPEVRATIRDHQVGEDCLALNVWSKQLGGNRKMPVMVWLHGGGFTSGNGGYTIYDGANLARTRDVVAVTVNHRLNTFGFLNLKEIGGEKFAQSSNVGMLDIVAALEWVRDNIAAFGGDPQNVTIYGQSGGAGKVSTLLAMPPAKGLFHRAIIQSGSAITGVPQAEATKGARALMAKLGARTAEDLQKLTMEQIIEGARGLEGLRLAPVVDGWSLPRDPFRPDAPELAANVPVLIGTTETEVTFFPNQPLDPIDDSELLKRVKEAARANDGQAKHLIDLYRKGRPGVSNIDLALILESDTRFRAGVLTVAELKSAQPAPVYMYYFTWRTPVRDGKLKSMHTLEILFVTANVDGAQSMTGTGQDRYALQERMSAAWTEFARTGDPNHASLPKWPPFNPTERATMFFDNECKVVSDPNGTERAALAALRRRA
jgi:para-nitrobenzyl esterase